MSIRSTRRLTALACVVLFGTAGGVHAAVITSLGTATDVNTVPLPGASGYVFYSVDAANSNDLSTGTPTRPVSFATVVPDVNDTRFAGGPFYSALTISGVAHQTGVITRGSAGGVQLVLATITLTNANGTTTGGAAVPAFRLGFLEDNTNTSSNNSPLQLSAPGTTASGTVRPGVTQKNDFLQFNVTGGVVGDVITIAGTSAGNASCIGGITFDVVPEPATLGLLGMVGTTLLARRRRA